jgi:hypothetical protein
MNLKKTVKYCRRLKVSTNFKRYEKIRHKRKDLYDIFGTMTIMKVFPTELKLVTWDHCVMYVRPRYIKRSK